MDLLSHSRKVDLAFALLYAFLGSAVISAVTSGGMGISFDSENYLAAANCLVEHRWSEAFNPVWPSLYPLTIAAVGSLGPNELLGAARIVSILSFAAVIVTVFLLGLRIQGRLTAHLSAISVAFLAPLVYLYSFCWSEVTYIAFSLLFLLFLDFCIKREQVGGTRYLILSALMAGLATATRYVGISLVVTGVLVILLLANQHSWRRRLLKVSAFFAVACAPVSLHYLITGYYYHGIPLKRQFPSDYALGHQIARFCSTIYGDFLTVDLCFWKYLFFFERGFPLLWFRAAILLCLSVLLASLLAILFSNRFRRDGPKLEIPILLYAAIYSSLILAISSIISVDPMGSRFVAPLYPHMILVVFSFVSRAYDGFAQHKTRRLVLGLFLLGLLSFWSVQIVSTLSIYRGVRSGSFPAVTHPGNRNRPSLKFLKQDASSHDLIITNVSRKLTWIWPRQEPYFNIPKKNWSEALPAIADQATWRSVYLLLCMEDYSPQAITVEDVEETNRNSGLFSWRKDFGNDLIFKTKRVVFQEPAGPDSGR